MAELKSKGVQGSKLVGDATNEGSIGLNTASGASDFVTGHLYWKKNLLGDSLIENAVVSHASLEFVFGRYGLDTTTYNPALPDTAGQAVLACFRGDGRTAAGTKIFTSLFGESMSAAALDAAVEAHIDPLDDIHASAGYRGMLARELTRRALQEATA